MQVTGSPEGPVRRGLLGVFLWVWVFPGYFFRRVENVVVWPRGIMSVAPRICVPTVKFLCSSLEWEMLSGFWRPLITGKMCLFFSWARRKLFSLCFLAPQDNKNYIFRVPLELFPQNFIYKRPQLCKVHLQSCLAKKALTWLHCYPVTLETNLCASPALDFYVTSELSLLWQRLWVWHMLCCSFLNLPGKAAMESSE